jgi:hypothetical protein
MWWKKKPEPPLREQLVAACEKVRRQLEIISSPGASNTSRIADNHVVIAELESELAQLEQALAELDADRV